MTGGRIEGLRFYCIVIKASKVCAMHHPYQWSVPIPSNNPFLRRMKLQGSASLTKYLVTGCIGVSKLLVRGILSILFVCWGVSIVEMSNTMLWKFGNVSKNAMVNSCPWSLLMRVGLALIRQYSQNHKAGHFNSINNHVNHFCFGQNNGVNARIMIDLRGSWYQNFPVCEQYCIRSNTHPKLQKALEKEL